MEAHETHEIAESVADGAQAPRASFHRTAALTMGVTAMLLAIASLGGENAMKETINANIQAANAYAFYQARNIRQDVYTATADALENTGKDAATYRARAERENGEKSKLLDEARRHDGERVTAQRRDGNFDYSRAFYQIAIVVGSVSIVASSRPLLWLSGGLALVATVLAANGFFLVV